MGLRPVTVAALVVLLGVAAIVAGTFLIAGLGPALIVGGVLAVALGLVVMPT